MSDLDKINIYVPERIGDLLEKDAQMFEIFKKDRIVNKNRFLNMLIKGYYDEYVMENNNKLKEVQKVLRNHSISDVDDSISMEIVKNIFRDDVPQRKGKNPIRLSLKPTNDTEGLILHIINGLGPDDYISQYLCKMIVSYSNKPINIREQIVFRDSFNMIEAAINSRQVISFSSLWGKGVFHKVLPYKIVPSREELFNYLLCAEMNTDTGNTEAKTYRINRMIQISPVFDSISLEADVKDRLNKMIKYGPQYTIMNDDEMCVRLSAVGQSTFNKIYYGRPDYERVEKRPDGYYYYFKCSEDQVFFYFRRFQGNEAVVMYPDALKRRMIEFHKSSFLCY